MKKKKKIVALIGSKNPHSTTGLVVSKLLASISEMDKNYEFEIIDMAIYEMAYCVGCLTCFKQGFCPLDESDNFSNIRTKMEEADILCFSSPVYVHSVSGIMKTFFDRTALSCHILNMAGKLGFTVTTTYSNGQGIVEEYLRTGQITMGIKNICNFTYVSSLNNLQSFIETSTQDFFTNFDMNFGYSDIHLEKRFSFYKNYYGELYENISMVDVEQINSFELEYWNQKWIKECKSFNEFAIKNRPLKE